MAIKTSGSLSMTEIVAEFGGSAPHSLNEYYGVAAGIPTSGTIAYNQFYGKSAQTTLTYPTGNYRRVNLADWVVSLGYAANGNFKITIDANTSFWSDSISLPALDASGLGSLHLVNNGRILGKGGQGYDAASKGPTTYQQWTLSAFGALAPGNTPAENGGPALSMCKGVVENNGYIAGGGGGGGAQLAPNMFVLGGGWPIPFTDYIRAFPVGSANGTAVRPYSSSNLQKGNFPTGVPFPTYIPANALWNHAIVQYTDYSGTEESMPWNGGGGGAGGGRGGRTGYTHDTEIGTAQTYYQTPWPPVPSAVGQTGGQSYFAGAGDATFQQGTDQGKYMVKEATPADAGGGGGGKHWSSAGNPYGSEIY
jgi:hypothetical protein